MFVNNNNKLQTFNLKLAMDFRMNVFLEKHSLLAVTDVAVVEKA